MVNLIDNNGGSRSQRDEYRFGCGKARQPVRRI